MKKRLKKKMITKRYNFGINLLSTYCELPVKTVIKEVSDDLWQVASNLDNESDDLIPYLDSVSINLMIKYNSGWAGKQ